MTPEEYTIAAERTINHDLSPDEQLKAQLMGIVVETGEILGEYKRSLYQGKPLDVKAVLDECGDVLWSVANLRRLRGEKFDPSQSEKWIYIDDIDDGLDSFLLEAMASALNPNALTFLEAHLVTLVCSLGGTIEGVMEANVAKLKARYPAGFPVIEEERVETMVILTLEVPPQLAEDAAKLQEMIDAKLAAAHDAAGALDDPDWPANCMCETCY